MSAGILYAKYDSSKVMPLEIVLKCASSISRIHRKVTPSRGTILPSLAFNLKLKLNHLPGLPYPFRPEFRADCLVLKVKSLPTPVSNFT